MTIEYMYDGDGSLCEKIVKDANGQITEQSQYYYDYSSGLPRVLSEYDVLNGKTIDYTYAGRMYGKCDNSSMYYYHQDGLGSILAITDENGTAANTYTYDAFGDLRSKNETISNNILFTGELVDEAGNVYLRARLYDPTIGRFLTKDTYAGDINQPQSLNLYSYCENNPVMYVDSSGCMPVEALRGLSNYYNNGTLDSSFTSTLTLLANGFGTYTAFHEIAQLNIAKRLKELGLDSILEYPITSKTQKNIFGKCKKYEADVVTGKMVWEVKPLGTDGSVQLAQYMEDGDLISGFTLKDITNIPVFSDYKMGITFEKPGTASYYFYKQNGKGENILVPSKEVQEEYSKRAAAASLAFAAITAGTVAEDYLTAGAGTMDDAVSLLAALRAATAILAY